MSFNVKSKSLLEMDTGKLFILFSLMILGNCALEKETKIQTVEKPHTTAEQTKPILSKHLEIIENSENAKRKSNDMQEFENVLLEYAKDVINRKTINIVPGVYIQKKTNKEDVYVHGKSLEGSFANALKEFIESHVLRVDLARASTATGRLFFFKGKRNSDKSTKTSLILLQV